MAGTRGARAEKAQQRKNQVLEAAARCFRQVGFHSTSMAEIAQESGMSVGHIYRYFPSKESLIEGIVLRDLERQLEGFIQLLDEHPEDPLAGVALESERCAAIMLDAERTALMLEIAAEAARNPRIRAYADINELRVKQLMRERLQAVRPKAWSEEELDARLQLLGAMFQGLAMQAVLHCAPPSPAVMRALSETARRLLTAEAPAETKPA